MSKNWINPLLGVCALIMVGVLISNQIGANYIMQEAVDTKTNIKIKVSNDAFWAGENDTVLPWNITMMFCVFTRMTNNTIELYINGLMQNNSLAAFIYTPFSSLGLLMISDLGNVNGINNSMDVENDYKFVGVVMLMSTGSGYQLGVIGRIFALNCNTISDIISIEAFAISDLSADIDMQLISSHEDVFGRNIRVLRGGVMTQLKMAVFDL